MAGECSNGHTGKVKLTENARLVLAKRYLKRDTEGKVVETPEEMFRRVARTIAAVDRKYDKLSDDDIKNTEDEFYDVMASLDFLPNSPTLMNAGREMQQLSACFVLPIEDSISSIFEAVKDSAIIHKSGGGTGFSFSKLRPKDDVVQSTGGIASGVLSFMEAFNVATDVVKQGGVRRGANMAVLRVDHPEIRNFIHVKEDPRRLNNFNLSVGITEDFMNAVEKDKEFPLVNPRNGRETERVRAREIFGEIAEAAWSNGEPGMVFLDRINAANPTPQLGMIEATNPCGEQPLLPYESCNLGSINLSHFVRLYEDGNAISDVAAVVWDGLNEPELSKLIEKISLRIDLQRLAKTVRTAVHFLDNVIDANEYPIEKIAKITIGNRKIGLGVMGFADMLIMLGVPYDTEAAIRLGELVMSKIEEESRSASLELAKKRGVFPNFTKSVFYDREQAEKNVGKYSYRNATLTTIAPTGTISMIANCSSGIEPLYAVAYVRLAFEKERMLVVNPHFERMMKERGMYSEALLEKIAELGSVQCVEEVPMDIRRLFVDAHDIAPEWHIRVQAGFQAHVDNAVSKTINFRESATIDEVRSAFLLAYRLGVKGITAYREGSRRGQVLSKMGLSPPQIARPRPRPKYTHGRTEKMQTACGNLYVTINEDEAGLCEVFVQMGKSGGCAMSQLEAIARLVSLALRAGVDTESILKQLRGIRCPSPMLTGNGAILSCPDAIAKAIESYLASKCKVCAAAKGAPREEHEDVRIAEIPNVVGVCPECGDPLVQEGGCSLCRSCGYTRCGV